MLTTTTNYYLIATKSTTMATDNASLFLTISSYLTGYTETDLLGTGMTDTYYAAVIQNNDPTVLGFLFAEVNDILTNNKKEDDINAAIAARLVPSSCYNGLAQTIILLWYTGNYGNNVLNGEAYIQGLMWDAAGAHPPGAKQPGYGSWELPPFANTGK